MTGTRRLPRRALHVAAVLLLVALVVPFVVYAVPETAGADESYVVLTASMTPDIAPGDAVLVREVTAGEVRVGDVITFRPRGGGDVPVTHRVVDVAVLSDGTRTFVTKGDANEDADAGVVTPDRLVGKVVLVVPYVGHVVGFVDSPVGFVLLVILPIGALIATEVADVVLEARRKRLAARGVAAEGESDDETDESNGLPDSDPAVAASTTDADGEIALSRTDLTFTVGALAAFAAYAVYVAVGEVTPLSVAVAVGAVATLALVVVLRQSIPPGEGAPTPESGVPVADGGDEAAPESGAAGESRGVDA
jgi:signal peptidase